MRATVRALVAVVLAATLVASCADKPIVVQPYDRAPVPAVPDHTLPIPDAADSPLPDGQYWAETAEVAGSLIRFTLAQAFFGPSCEAELGADACADDHGVRGEPSHTIDVAAEGRAPISVVDSDRQNYAVTADEIVNLVGGGTPSADAPEGFEYQPYPYLLTVQNGEVVSLQQIWTP